MSASLVSVSENFDIGEKVGKDLVSRSVASPVLKDISAAQKMFPRFAVVHRCMCIYIIYYILGTGLTAKSDEFSDKFQTGFDPPPLIFIELYRNFSENVQKGPL